MNRDEQWPDRAPSVKVYQAICNISAELSKTGIAKDRKNQQQGYAFRGIDDCYNALAPLLAKHRLCILPRVIEHSVVERTSQKGGALFYTTMRIEFDFVSAEDASKHTITTVGEAMDSADKSSNKAQSAAYKYAVMQVFCIPTEADNDADAVTHQVAAYAPAAPAPVRAAITAPPPAAAPVATLTLAQIKHVQEAADAAGLTTMRICEVGRVRSLAEIKASSYVTLLDWITAQKNYEPEHVPD